MANDVFANGREVSCKAGDGKSICAFPDVCFTPPENPATPPGVPVPYPNTGMDSHTTDGSRSVLITGKEVMLKNKSYFKQSTGDEAGCAAKKGVVTSVNRGKVYFCCWSMDVKIEGENAVRHLDMTTHNHASPTTNTPPWPFCDSQALSTDPCVTNKDAERTACSNLEVKTKKGKVIRNRTKAKQCANTPDAKACQEAQKCMLTPYGGKGSPNCCDGVQAHHLVEVHCFTEEGLRASGGRVFGQSNYNDVAAPCVCATGAANEDKEHGMLHSVQGKLEREYAAARKNSPLWDFGYGENRMSYWTYDEARDVGAAAHKAVYQHCDEECIKAQLDAYHIHEAKVAPDDSMRTDLAVRRDEVPLNAPGRHAVAEARRKIWGIR